ncbi:Hypothetical protein NTJ_15161 [Nesidiocoris tenuis]|uniref:Uncharacterized protein n=1 Tax=Nesidiocoris tenuis TaxID=355587 RepID=A0ABN7BD92_9HEMI|nr:Hypothetical protein NTJ_15161 [Nesidiocoris tenuis]
MPKPRGGISETFEHMRAGISMAQPSSADSSFPRCHRGRRIHKNGTNFSVNELARIDSNLATSAPPPHPASLDSALSALFPSFSDASFSHPFSLYLRKPATYLRNLILAAHSASGATCLRRVL